MLDSLARTGRDRLALAALFAGAGAIAFAPIFVRISELGPTATAFWRVAFAVPALCAWLALEGRASAPPPEVAAGRSGLVLAGAFFAADLAFWHWSIKLTSVANSTLLANLTPVFVTLGAYLVFGQRFKSRFLVAMAIALAGAAILMGDSLTLSIEHVLGDALGVVTAFFYGAYLLVVSRLRATYSTATIMTWSGAVSAAALLPVAWLSGEGLMATGIYGWAVLLGLALFSHAGGQSLIAYALAHLPAAFSSVGLLVQPVLAAVLAWILLAEPLGAVQALGGAVVLVGIVLARRASR